MFRIPTRSLQPLALLLMLCAGSLNAQPADFWGIEFPTSETGPAQLHFLEGVAAMHLHMFEDAETHFRAAQALSPGFVMAYWGEALNNHRTIWRIHRRDDAVAVLKRLAPSSAERAALAPTDRERRYLSAVEALFGDAPFAQREAEYAAVMGELSEAYPDDVEARAWYALSLMRITPAERTREQTRSLMASLSLEVLAANPRHPGANRYLIQSTDDPENTDLGIIAVNNLANLDIEAAEALHIPSHYYIQHGMWLETAESNRRAFDSSMAWVAANGWQLQDLNDHNYGHLLRFAHYGYQQAGIDSEARSIRERVLDDFRNSGGAAEIAAPLADTFARWVIDLEQWHQAPALANLATEHGLAQPGLWTAIGIAAVRHGDQVLAARALSVLEGQAGDSPNDAEIGASQVAGLIEVAAGRTETGLALLRAAVEASDRLHTLQPVTLIGIPPRPLKPARELLGEVLLDTGAAAPALAQFQAGLLNYQGRSNLLLGASRAAVAAGELESAARFRAQLLQAWRQADPDHPLRATLDGIPTR